MPSDAAPQTSSGEAAEPRAELLAAISLEYKLHPYVVRSLITPHLRGEAAGAAATYAELRRTLSPVVRHHLDYNLSVVARGRRIYEAVQPFLKPKRRPVVLDIGCGFGGMLLPFGEQGFELHGVEPNAARRRACMYNLSHVGLSATFHEIDLSTFALDGQSFDVIICNSVIEHVLDPVAMIERIGGMLLPGGVLFFGVANKDAMGCVIADPHYGLFGLTLLPPAIARRYYDLLTADGQDYSVTDFFSIESYMNLLRSEIGAVHVTTDPEQRGIALFPNLLTRLAAGYEATLRNPRLSPDRMLRRQFEQAFNRYCSITTRSYAEAIENGTQQGFTQAYIRKSHQIIAVKQ